MGKTRRFFFFFFPHRPQVRGVRRGAPCPSQPPPPSLPGETLTLSSAPPFPSTPNKAATPAALRKSAGDLKALVAGPGDASASGRRDANPIALAAAAAARMRRQTLTAEEVEAIMGVAGGGAGAPGGGGGDGGGAGGPPPPPPAKAPSRHGHGRRGHPPPPSRVVLLGPGARLPPAVSNAVRTAKYNPVTFLPRFLFEMFSRAAYLYFLLQAILSWISVVSPFGGTGSTLALAFVLSVAAVKALVEDAKRHAQDRATNASVAHLVEPDGSVRDIPWRDVRVGQVRDFFSFLFLLSFLLSFRVLSSQPSTHSHTQPPDPARQRRRALPRRPGLPVLRAARQRVLHQNHKSRRRKQPEDSAPCRPA
jgi:hypothetical protein